MYCVCGGGGRGGGGEAHGGQQARRRWLATHDLAVAYNVHVAMAHWLRARVREPVDGETREAERRAAAVSGRRVNAQQAWRTIRAARAQRTQACRDNMLRDVRAEKRPDAAHRAA